MKTTISIQPTLKARIANRVSVWLASDNLLFSKLMEEKVSNRTALLVTHVMLSLSCLLVFAPLHWAAAIVLLCWFVLSVYQWKKGGIK